jgi:endonuclease G
MYKVRPNDYTGSGYNRRHIAGADRTRNEADNSSTFLMTNMMPLLNVWTKTQN